MPGSIAPVTAERSGNGRATPPAVAGSPKLQGAATWLLLALALFWTAHAAQSFLLPLLVAVLLKFVLAPIVRAAHRRLHVPPPLGAAVLLLVLLAGTGYGLVALSGPASTWLRDIPERIGDLRYRFEAFRFGTPVEDISEAAKEVDAITRDDDAPPVVTVEQPSFLTQLLSGVQSVLVTSMLSLACLYFLLATDGSLTPKLVELAPRLRQKRHVVAAVRSVERQVTRYVSAVTLINATLGAVVAAWMYATGMPAPVLWGVLAAFLNFVPYLGAVVGVGIVTLVAASTFDTVGAMIAPPLGYAVVNSLEGLVITPAVLGRWHALSPVAIFVWLLLWSWLWGVAGALLAVPLLMFVKIVCDHTAPLRPVGLLLASPRPRRRPPLGRARAPRPA